ncbi:MAG: hypothetical protein KKD94_00855, partial [Nanoarchaeota archaeon]|nr:hypothetical protein [Nanoarchaeota archaeon]
CTEITGKVIAESPYQEGSFFGHSSTPYTFSLRCIDGDSMIFEAYNGSKGKIDSLVNQNFDVTVRLGQSQRPLGGAYKIDQEQLIRISDAEGNRIR